MKRVTIASRPCQPSCTRPSAEERSSRPARRNVAYIVPPTTTRLPRRTFVESYEAWRARYGTDLGDDALELPSGSRIGRRSADDICSHQHPQRDDARSAESPSLTRLGQHEGFGISAMTWYEIAFGVCRASRAAKDGFEARLADRAAISAAAPVTTDAAEWLAAERVRLREGRPVHGDGVIARRRMSMISRW